MGIFGGGPSIPAPPPIPPAANPPILANAAVKQAGENQRNKGNSQNGMGFAGTVTNTGGAAGLESTNKAGKSLLGD